MDMEMETEMDMEMEMDMENMAVLSDVIKGQREILGRVHGKDPAEIPQLWAVFTETISCTS
jgi:hypothetical protein